MSDSDLHKNKRKTNFIILALIGAFCALIWGITVVKMGMQSSGDDAVQALMTEGQDSALSVSESNAAADVQ